MPDDPRPASDNERMLLAEIWRNPGKTRSALSGGFNISQQSIHRIVTSLEERGILTLGQLEPPQYKGKPSPRLNLNPKYCCSLGVSINTDSAGVCLVDFAGDLDTRTISIEGLSMSQTMSRLDDVASKLVKAAGFDWADVFGVGFAIAGFVIDGTRYSAPLPLSEWSQLQLGPYLTDHFKLPVWTENGANTGALYEHMFGLGRDHDNFVYLSFNYGFGGGIIVDGELMRGGFGNAGELSGMFTLDEMPHRPRLRSLLEELQSNGVDVSSIHDLAKRFDPSWPGVATWLDRVTGATNRVINVLNAVVDPELIVFGGQIPNELAHMLIARCGFYRAEGRYDIIRKQPRMMPSTMGGETAAMGAALLPLKASFF
ncbi:ROK family transcriptional regulator [Roseibium sp.]|uniref:ROK family transcriptional regulator n=1 Tax=Roseibium sp. TaxID=1936156 RepID=UPI003B5056F5